jgi:hypothetical protein
MKKFILGLITGAVLFLPSGALAWTSMKPARPQPIYQFSCWNPNNGGIERLQCLEEVAVFDDQDNKCYVAYDRWGEGSSSISCVKETEL